MGAFLEAFRLEGPSLSFELTRLLPWFSMNNNVMIEREINHGKSTMQPLFKNKSVPIRPFLIFILYNIYALIHTNIRVNF